MTRTTIADLKKIRLARMTADESAVFDNTYEATHLAHNVDEKVRGARQAAVSARESRCKS